MRKKIILYSICVILVLGGVFLFFRLQQTPVRILVLGNFSGLQSVQGKSLHRGVLYQLELLDPKNTRFDLVTIDLNQFPDDELLKNAIIAAKPDMMIGPETSTGYLRVKQIIDDLKILTIGPSISTDKASGMKDTVFRLSVTQKKIVGYAAEAMNTYFSASNVKILYSSTNLGFSLDYASLLHAILEKGSGKSTINLLDMTTAAEIAKTADAIMLIAPAGESGQTIQRLRSASINCPVIMTSWSISNDFYRFVADEMADLYLVTSLPPTTHDGYDIFYKEWDEQFKEIPAFGNINGIDAVILAHKIAQVASQKRLTLLEAAQSIDHFTGLFDDYWLDEFGDCSKKMYLLQLHGKEMTQVVTYE